MPKPGPLFIAAFSFVVSHATNAEGPLSDGWYVSPMWSFIDDDPDRDVDDGFAGFHLGIGKQFDPVNAIELGAVGTSFNADGFDADQKQWGLGIDYIRRFGDQRHFEPYALVGLGFLHSQNRNPAREDGSGGMASIGIGALSPLGFYALKARTELRLRVDRSAGSHQDVLLSFGVWRALREKKHIPRDADFDGVADADDRCGDTPRDAPVDAYGCARSRDEK